MTRIEQIKQFLQRQPKDNFLQHALALEYVKEGMDEEARMQFEEILERDPAYIGSYYHLARLLEKNAEKELAMDWYEKGMEAAKKAGDEKTYNELRAAYDELVF